MSTAYVAQYRELARDPGGEAVPLPTGFITSSQVTFTGTASTPLALADGCRYVVWTTDANHIYDISAAPDVSATGRTGRAMGAWQQNVEQVAAGSKIQFKGV